MNFSDFIIKYVWLIFWFLGTIFTYYFWILPEWNLLRIKNNLITSNDMDDMTRKFICKDFKFPFLFLRIKIFLLSLLISFIITLSQWYAVEGKVIENLYDVAGLSFPLIIMYTLLSGIKDNQDNDESDKNKDLLKFKIKILNLFLEKEKKIYISSIKSHIKMWYESEKDTDCIIFPTFVIRLNDKIFIKILEDACNLNDNGNKMQESKKAILLEKPVEIMESYHSEDINNNVLTNSIYLIDEYFRLENSKPCEIINFISHTEISCKGKNKDMIIKNLATIISKDSNNKNKNKQKTITNDKFERLFGQISMTDILDDRRQK